MRNQIRFKLNKQSFRVAHPFLIVSLICLTLSIGTIACNYRGITKMNRADSYLTSAARSYVSQRLELPEEYLKVNEIYNPFMKKYKLFKVATGDMPPRIVIVAVDNEKQIIPLAPVNEFTRMIQRESLSITELQEAIEYAKLYLEVTHQDSAHIKIVKNAADIPGITNEQVSQYGTKIIAPRGQKVSEGFVVEMVTWSFGELQRYTFTINQNGNVVEHGDLIAKNIGTYVTLE